MTSVGNLRSVHPNDNVLSVLEKMDKDRVNELPVIWEGRLLGVVEREKLVNLMHLRSELKV